MHGTELAWEYYIHSSDSIIDFLFDDKSVKHHIEYTGENAHNSYTLVWAHNPFDFEIILLSTNKNITRDVHTALHTDVEQLRIFLRRTECDIKHTMIQYTNVRNYVWLYWIELLNIQRVI